MERIRQAKQNDLARIAEIILFNYRLNFYPIFRNDDYYFNELQVPKLMEKYEKALDRIFVFDDGAVKGFVELDKEEIKKLFVEPVLQKGGIGSLLLCFATTKYQANRLWALEKNTDAIRFYERHGFYKSTKKILEEGTKENLILLKREC